MPTTASAPVRCSGASPCVIRGIGPEGSSACASELALRLLRHLTPRVADGGLEWSQVDFPHGVVSIAPGQTKGGEGRTFVMTPELRKLLRGQRAQADAIERRTGEPCRWVFHLDGQPITYIYRWWQQACEGAKVPGRLLHDMRRTAIRNLIHAGVSGRVAMQMCGHKTRSIFDRYNITSERDLRSAAGLLSAHHRTLAREAKASRSRNRR